MTKGVCWQNTAAAFHDTSASNSIYSPLYFLAADGWLIAPAREKKINSGGSSPSAWSIAHPPCKGPDACRGAGARRAGRGGALKKPRLRGEIAVGRSAPQWVIAHLSPRWSVRGNSCPSSRIQSAECSSGRLMDVSTGGAIWEKGAVDGSHRAGWDYVRLLSFTSVIQ